MKKILACMGVMSIFALSATDAAADNMKLDPKFYLGFGLGQASIDTGVDSTTGSAELDEDDFAYKIYGGVQLNKIFGLEAHYADLGEASLSGNNGDTFTFEGNTFTFIANGVEIDASAKSYGLGLTAGYPVTDMFRPYAKLGMHRWDIDASVTSSAGSASLTDSGTDVFGGLGLEVNVYKGLSIRGEFERFKFDDEDVDFFSAGLNYKF